MNEMDGYAQPGGAGSPQIDLGAMHLHCAVPTYLLTVTAAVSQQFYRWPIMLCSTAHRRSLTSVRPFFTCCAVHHLSRYSSRYLLDGPVHGARARHPPSHSRMSDAHPASRIERALAISGTCGTFPCVCMLLQNLRSVPRLTARSYMARARLIDI